MKRFEYLPLDKELKAQADIEKKRCKTLGKIQEIDEKINKKPTLKNYSKLDLMYDGNYSFYKYYRDIKQFDRFYLKSKYSFLANIQPKYC